MISVSDGKSVFMRIEFNFRCDGDQEKYDRAMRAEQKRHAEAVNEIERDYRSGSPWR